MVAGERGLHSSRSVSISEISKTGFFERIQNHL